jgi:hypothetical protein
MSRRTYIFAGPAESGTALTSIIEAALDAPFIREPGSDPYIRADPVSLYTSGHDFEDGDIDFPGGTPVPLKSAYPHLIDIRDTERNLGRQQAVAARIFAAIKADGRINAVCIDDMQHVLDSCNSGPSPQAELGTSPEPASEDDDRVG